MGNLTQISLNVATQEYNVKVANAIVAIISKKFRVNWLDKAMKKNTMVVEEVNAFIVAEQNVDYTDPFDMF